MLVSKCEIRYVKFNSYLSSIQPPYPNSLTALSVAKAKIALQKIWVSDISMPGLNARKGKRAGLNYPVMSDSSTDDPIQPHWFQASGINDGDKRHLETMTYRLLLMFGVIRRVVK